MDEDENENIFVEEEISDDDELDEIHPEDMSDAMRTLNQALIDADDHIDGNHTYHITDMIHTHMTHTYCIFQKGHVILT